MTIQLLLLHGMQKAEREKTVINSIYKTLQINIMQELYHKVILTIFYGSNSMCGTAVARYRLSPIQRSFASSVKHVDEILLKLEHEHRPQLWHTILSWALAQRYIEKGDFI